MLVASGWIDGSSWLLPVLTVTLGMPQWVSLTPKYGIGICIFLRKMGRLMLGPMWEWERRD